MVINKTVDNIEILLILLLLSNHGIMYTNFEWATGRRRRVDTCREKREQVITKDEFQAGR